MANVIVKVFDGNGYTLGLNQLVVLKEEGCEGETHVTVIQNTNLHRGFDSLRLACETH